MLGGQCDKVMTLIPNRLNKTPSQNFHEVVVSSAHQKPFPPTMKILSPEAQLSMLRAATENCIARKLHHWMIGSAIVLIIVSAILWHPVPLIIAAILGVAGVAEQHAIPNILNALHAYDSVVPASGSVKVTITRLDSDDHYHAIVRQDGQAEWAYDFIPQGWSPVAGSHPARIWCLDKDAPPVLAAVDDGILVPRNKQEKLPLAQAAKISGT